METVNFLYPTYVGCTARICKPYSSRMQAVRHTDVSYKLTAIKVGLLSHTSRIYIDSLQQKQAILRLFEPYLAILLMRDTRPLFGGIETRRRLRYYPVFIDLAHT